MSRWLEKQKELETQGIPNQPAVFEIDTPKTRPNLRASELKPGEAYKWKKNDSLVDVARRMGVSVERLREYNEIESWNELDPGVIIYKPKDVAVPKRQIRYELFLNDKKELVPRDYHVNTPKGAKKWRFGNAPCGWEDISSTGFFPQNTNVRVVAIAYVPIEDPDNPELEAAYFMDLVALGDYPETGRIKFTVGFIHADLEEGLAVKPFDLVPSISSEAAPPVTLPENNKIPVTTETSEESEEPAPSKSGRVDFFGTDKAFVENRLEYFKREGSMSKFVETYQRLEPHVPCIALIPDDLIETDEVGRKFTWIHDFLTSRPDRKLVQHWEGEIAGTFEYEGVLYGRPVAAIKSGVWYGIPMDYLESQARLYNDDTDAETRSVTGNLTWFETNFWVPFTKWATNPRKNKNNKE
jgi:LysM repeat protein